MVDRRKFLRGLIAAPFAGVAAGAAYARLIEPYNYLISDIEVYLHDLPERFENFRITHLTDVHHSQIVGLNEIRRVVQLAQETKPDMFVLTGDYTTAYRRYIEPCAEALSALRAPEGVWAVLGNHDHYTDPELTTRALRRNQIVVMNNSNTAITRGPDTLQLSGVDDWSWNANDWQRALGALKKDVPTVLLSHQPTVLDLAETQNVSLILSGHTHGGQIDIPFIGAPVRYATREMKYSHGLYRRGETQLYVSSGTGVIGLPARFGVRPEIAVFRLKRG